MKPQDPTLHSSLGVLFLLLRFSFLFLIYLLFWLSLVSPSLTIKSSALHKLGKHSTTKLHPCGLLFTGSIKMHKYSSYHIYTTLFCPSTSIDWPLYPITKFSNAHENRSKCQNTPTGCLGGNRPLIS